MTKTSVAMNVAVGAAADVPMVGNLVQAVGAEIKVFYDSKHISNESCAGFLESIKRSKTVLNQLDENQARDLSEHHPVREWLESYKIHIELIRKRCDKWGTKPPWKQYRDGRRYTDEFDAFKKMFDHIVRNLNLAIQAQTDANMRKRFIEVNANIDKLRWRIDKAPSSPPTSSLPELIELIGRESELSSLENTFQRYGTMASLSGGGGMGKSHIAKTFARAWYEADKDARFVWWIASETEVALRRDYLELLAAMGEPIPVEEEGKMPTSEIASFVWRRLSSLHFDWMVVFDNVPESHGGPEGFRPLFFPTPLRGFSRGRVLFTSRSQLFVGHTCIGHFANVSVEPLLESEAVRMLMFDVPVGKYDDSDEEKERNAALQFSRRLGCLPLALATVSGYVLSRGISVQEYLDEFESCDVTEAVSKALHDALTYARDQGMSDIIDIAAFVNPDSIPLELLGGDTVRGNARHLCAMNILRRTRRDVYSVHRLHQEVLREGRSSAMALDALDCVLDSFCPYRSETWQLGRDMNMHITAVENHAKYTTNQEKILLSRILHHGGKFLCIVVNDFDGAEAMLNKAVALERHVYGDNTKNIHVADILNQVGIVHSSRGEYDEARLMYEEALAMKRHVFGDNGKNASMASTLNKFGLVQFKRGEYDKALAMYEEALEIKRHMYGQDASNADLANTLMNIGLVRQKRGDYDDALQLYEEAMAMRRHAYGKDARNADFIAALNNMGMVYDEWGDYSKALAMYKEALEMKRSMYGEDARNNTPSGSRSLNFSCLVAVSAQHIFYEAHEE